LSRINSIGSIRCLFNSTVLDDVLPSPPSEAVTLDRVS
jgi:hypothetical protein